MWFVIIFAVAMVLLYHQASLLVWTIVAAFTLLFASQLSQSSMAVLTVWWALFLIIALLLNVRSLRRLLLTRHIFSLYCRLFPETFMAKQENLSLQVGGFEQELFRGCPNWPKLWRKLSMPGVSTLSQEEQTLIGNIKFVVLKTAVHARVSKRPSGYFANSENEFASMAGNLYILDALCHAEEKYALNLAVVTDQAKRCARQIISAANHIQNGDVMVKIPNHHLPCHFFEEGILAFHPYLLTELHAALQYSRGKASLSAFDKALWSHLGYTMSNVIRSLWLALTKGYFVIHVGKSPIKHYFQQLSHFSAAFALLVDALILTLGANLAEQERLCARLSTIFGALNLGAAVLLYFKDQGSQEEELPLVHWSCQALLFVCQEEINNVLNNVPYRWLALSLRLCIFPLGREVKPPRDQLDHQLAGLLLKPSAVRDSLLKNVATTKAVQEEIDFLEQSLQAVIAVQQIEKRLDEASYDQESPEAAVTAGIISAEEGRELLAAQAVRDKISKMFEC